MMMMPTTMLLTIGSTQKLRCCYQTKKILHPSGSGIPGTMMPRVRTLPPPNELQGGSTSPPLVMEQEDIEEGEITGEGTQAEVQVSAPGAGFEDPLEVEPPAMTGSEEVMALEEEPAAMTGSEEGMALEEEPAAMTGSEEGMALEEEPAAMTGSEEVMALEEGPAAMTGSEEVMALEDEPAAMTGSEEVMALDGEPAVMTVSEEVMALEEGPAAMTVSDEGVALEGEPAAMIVSEEVMALEEEPAAMTGSEEVMALEVEPLAMTGREEIMAMEGGQFPYTQAHLGGAGAPEVGRGSDAGAWELGQGSGAEALVIGQDSGQQEAEARSKKEHEAMVLERRKKHNAMVFELWPLTEQLRLETVFNMRKERKARGLFMTDEDHGAKLYALCKRKKPVLSKRNKDGDVLPRSRYQFPRPRPDYGSEDFFKTFGKHSGIPDSRSVAGLEAGGPSGVGALDAGGGGFGVQEGGSAAPTPQAGNGQGIPPLSNALEVGGPSGVGALDAGGGGFGAQEGGSAAPTPQAGNSQGIPPLSNALEVGGSSGDRELDFAAGVSWGTGLALDGRPTSTPDKQGTPDVFAAGVQWGSDHYLSLSSTPSIVILSQNVGGPRGVGYLDFFAGVSCGTAVVLTGRPTSSIYMQDMSDGFAAGVRWGIANCCYPPPTLGIVTGAQNVGGEQDFAAGISCGTVLALTGRPTPTMLRQGTSDEFAAGVRWGSANWNPQLSTRSIATGA